ncbi:unnamed protein product [Rhizoctonia solani]|uniref:Uncharacterized protein n=1 Tax=Rhizoctonia solani TaxID=456999 RepID=A0A8H3AXM0_9AGAM|nr:unnamed protein product [Rhizoctonia solani]
MYLARLPIPILLSNSFLPRRKSPLLPLLLLRPRLRRRRSLRKMTMMSYWSLLNPRPRIRSTISQKAHSTSKTGSVHTLTWTPAVQVAR